MKDSLLSNLAVKRLRRLFVSIVNKIMQFSFMSSQRIGIPQFSPASPEMDSLNSPLGKMQESFSGTSLMYHLVESDWLLYSPHLYEENVVIIGGFHGVATRRILRDTPKVNKIHVYEPVPEFAALQPLDTKVTTYSQAIWSEERNIDICLDGDFSFVPETGRAEYARPIEKTMRVEATTWQRASDRIGRKPVTLFMNAEGSEYPILSDMLKKGSDLPRKIIFQTHKVGQNPHKTLFELRSKLADFYEPIVCFDFAWDVWVLN